VGDQFAQGLHWFMFPAWLGDSHVVHGAHLFILSIDMQADLEPAAVVVRNGTKFSQCSMAGAGGAFHRLGFRMSII
jgi:hypothetical protein